MYRTPTWQICKQVYCSTDILTVFVVVVVGVFTRNISSPSARYTLFVLLDFAEIKAE